MGNSDDQAPVSPGQEICIFLDDNNQDSMSSLESFMSFGDDSEEDHHVVVQGPVKRRKPRRAFNSNANANANPTHSHPKRQISNPELGSPRLPANGVPSRWKNLSLSSSPGRPRNTRHMSPTRPRPTMKVGDEDDDGSVDLEALQPDRWSASASSSRLMSNGNQSTSRWQDSFSKEFDSGHSRWSGSVTSSFFEQLSTRPRVPLRKKSGLLAKNGSVHSATNTTSASSAMAEDGSFSNKATTGSEIEEFSTDLESHNKVVLDCSVMQQEMTKVGLKSATKPRPQLPHRQKSFGRGLSIGMAAKAAFERDEPTMSMPERKLSDLSLSSLTSEKSATPPDRRNSFFRQRSLPQRLFSVKEQTEEKEVMEDISLRKQRSCSCLVTDDVEPLEQPKQPASLSTPNSDQPQLPERVPSAISTLSNESIDRLKTFRKQKSLSSLLADDADSPLGSKQVSTSSNDGPQLPQRLPSALSQRDLAVSEDAKTETNGGCSPPTLPQRQASAAYGMLVREACVPPPMPERQVSAAFDRLSVGEMARVS